jgi:hypothetical protein
VTPSTSELVSRIEKLEIKLNHLIKVLSERWVNPIDIMSCNTESKDEQD